MVSLTVKYPLFLRLPLQIEGESSSMGGGKVGQSIIRSLWDLAWHQIASDRCSYTPDICNFCKVSTTERVLFMAPDHQGWMSYQYQFSCPCRITRKQEKCPMHGARQECYIYSFDNSKYAIFFYNESMQFSFSNAKYAIKG